MPALTITAVERDPETGAVHLISGKTTYTWGSIEVLREWLILNRKECDACLRAAVTDILAANPDLDPAKFVPTKFTLSEPSVSTEAISG